MCFCVYACVRVNFTVLGRSRREKGACGTFPPHTHTHTHTHTLINTQHTHTYTHTLKNIHTLNNIHTLKNIHTLQQTPIGRSRRGKGARGTAPPHTHSHTQTQVHTHLHRHLLAGVGGEKGRAAESHEVAHAAGFCIKSKAYAMTLTRSERGKERAALCCATTVGVTPVCVCVCVCACVSVMLHCAVQSPLV